MTLKGRLLALAVVALALSAGCQSFTGGGSMTATPDGTNDSSAANETAFKETHAKVLQQAGNATKVFRSTQEVTGANGSDVRNYTLNQTVRTRVSFDSGRAIQKYDPLWGGSSVTYRNGSGTTFQKSGDRYEVSTPGEPGHGLEASIDGLTSSAEINTSVFQNRGHGTVDGVTGQVYTTKQLDEYNREVAQGWDPENLTSYNATFVVDDRGFVSYYHIRAKHTRERGTVRQVWTVRITDVGTTTVEPPEWLDEAKNATSDRR